MKPLCESSRSLAAGAAATTSARATAPAAANRRRGRERAVTGEPPPVRDVAGTVAPTDQRADVRDVNHCHYPVPARRSSTPLRSPSSRLPDLARRLSSPRERLDERRAARDSSDEGRETDLRVRLVDRFGRVFRGGHEADPVVQSLADEPP